MATVHMICGKYYDFDKCECTVGGIQTYMSALIPVVTSLGMKTVIYQNGARDETTTLGDTVIRAVKAERGWKDLKKVRASLKACMQQFNDTEDILIFTTDNRIVKNTVSRSIAIQHGICWDMPVHTNWSPALNSLYAFSKARLAHRVIARLSRVSRVVCVDHNFPNWMRASSAYEAVPLSVVPNFTKIVPLNKKPTDRVNIIFARRFEKYRGTRVFAGAIQRVLDTYPNVYVTVAGTGPDEKFLKTTLEKYGERVRFITYKSGESLTIHADQHIAVVPTVGSEGTSLSLLEAMSSQCAVICTDVGGMSNIVLDGFNGLFTRPTAESLHEKLALLIEDEALRGKLAENAYTTVKDAFSYEVWQERWKQILKDTAGK